MNDDPLWRRGVAGWQPSDPQAQELFDAFKVGDVCRFKPTRVRNAAFLRKFFALVRLCVDNTEGWDVQSLREYVAIQTGWFEPYTIPVMPGVVLKRPKSISFAKMDSESFNTFFSKAINILLRDVVPHISERELRDAVEMNLVMA
jgi:hypothetical protein